MWLALALASLVRFLNESWCAVAVGKAKVVKPIKVAGGGAAAAGAGKAVSFAESLEAAAAEDDGLAQMVDEDASAGAGALIAWSAPAELENDVEMQLEGAV